MTVSSLTISRGISSASGIQLSPLGMPFMIDSHSVFLFAILLRVLFLAEPISYRDAIVHQEWQNTMAEEIAALECTSTWDLVPLPPHVHSITCKWVYKVKTL